jgi:hypothetical protein
MKTGARLALAAAPLLAPGIVWSTFHTIRKVYIGSKKGLVDLRERLPRVCALWHQRVLMLLPENAPRRPMVMVSQSTDGEIAARVMKRMGFLLARGSSSKGGREALQVIIAHLRQGGMAGIIADGPLGPARVLKIGTILAARETGVPVYGITATASRSICVRSWDRTEIPLPFATVVYGYTEPFFVPRESGPDELESFRRRLERELNDMDARCVERAQQIARRER